MWQKLEDFFKQTSIDLLCLVAPYSCLSCRTNLSDGEFFLCFSCEHYLPKSSFYLQKENPLQEKFFGKLCIENAFAYMNFQKGASSQKILHKLKYHNCPEIGEYFGKKFGYWLKEKELLPQAEYIVPVPLHISKLRKRGYNQSEEIARGLAYSLKIPINCNLLQRKKATETQTKKNAQERWLNVQQIFEASEEAKGCKILLVDDVITTGATLEACAQALLEVGCKQIEIAALAAGE